MSEVDVLHTIRCAIKARGYTTKKVTAAGYVGGYYVTVHLKEPKGSIGKFFLNGALLRLDTYGTTQSECGLFAFELNDPTSIDNFIGALDAAAQNRLAEIQRMQVVT